MTPEQRRMSFATSVLNFVKQADSDEDIRKGFTSVAELPEEVREALPDEEAQAIFMNTYNNYYIDQNVAHHRAMEEAWYQLKWAGYIMDSEGIYRFVKSSTKFAAEITKFDTSQQLVFGWANVMKHADGSDVDDTQGDIVDTPEAIAAFEKAVYEYVELTGSGDEMHENYGVAQIVESFFVTPDKLEKMGLSSEDSPTGWFVGFKVYDLEVFEKVVTGEYPMFSIVGTGNRVEIDE